MFCRFGPADLPGGTPLLPEGLTSHQLLDTFASLLLVHDPDPVNARTQLGHADPSFTIEVYSASCVDLLKTRDHLHALIEGEVWH